MTKVSIHIGNVKYEVKAGNNLLETCIALGFDIPHFCYHPALGSVGACRLCAVKKYAGPDDKKGRIIMSCMEEVVEGMIISIDDPEVKTFRASILESLMTGHPHDCPVCDEGGECHLQDMVVMTGHTYRRYEYKKRTFYDQDLGPFINHEMNRCIQCYRCVRFYRNYAGGKDLNVYGSSNKVYFGRQKDGILENEFSGNLVEVCPTGVFTDKTLKNNYARKWDLTNAPSVCVHCSLGCNTIIGTRYGSVRRILSRYNWSVNGYFLCDRGRFGYEFLNNPGRIRKVQFKSGVAEENSLQSCFLWISNAIADKKIIGIGSPRASLEANHALSVLVGKGNFYHGISCKDHILAKKAVQILGSGIAHIPSLKEIEKCDTVLILGEDITNTAPMLALAVRQAARNKYLDAADALGIRRWNDAPAREMDQGMKSPVFITSPFSTGLDDVAEEIRNATSDKIAHLGYCIASLIDPSAPEISGIDRSLREMAVLVADALIRAKNPLIITGVNSGDEELLNASANIALALSHTGKSPSLSIVFSECNSLGLAMMSGGSIDVVADILKTKRTDALIIIENDLYRRTEREKADLIFERSDHVIVLDHLTNETTLKADLLLPVTSFAESTGTIINNEGRAQRYYSALPENEPAMATWCWLGNMMKAAGVNSWSCFDDVVTSLVADWPVFERIKGKMPDSGFRFYNEKIARQTGRFSGRTAMDSNKSVSEPGPPVDNCSPLAYSMEAYKGFPPPDLIPYYWSSGWNSVQAVNKYTEGPNGPLKNGGDPGVLLFGSAPAGSGDYYQKTKHRNRLMPDELLVVPVCQIFGSEELSSRGEAILKRTSKPFIILNENEISRMALAENEMHQLIVNEIIINVIIKTDNSVPAGVAGLSSGIPGVAYLNLPCPGKLLRTVDNLIKKKI
jgi:NADH-quinone oxidoreductase subunit G